MLKKSNRIKLRKQKKKNTVACETEFLVVFQAESCKFFKKAWKKKNKCPKLQALVFEGNKSVLEEKYEAEWDSVVFNLKQARMYIYFTFLRAETIIKCFKFN